MVVEPGLEGEPGWKLWGGGEDQVVQKGDEGVPVSQGPPILLALFYYYFFFFLYHVFIVTVQELACSASYGVKKTLISKQSNKVKPITDHLQVRQVPGASPT